MDEKSTKLQETLQDRMHWELCEFILLLFVKLLLYFFNNLLLCFGFFFRYLQNYQWWLFDIVLEWKFSGSEPLCIKPRTWKLVFATSQFI